jgi:SOS-response transcriptional repressor LexA
MRTLAERLEWAMRRAGLDPQNNQSDLARLVGGKCTPQTIQNILSGGQKTSKYTPGIAAALDCGALWLAEGVGSPPAMRNHETRTHNTGISDPNSILIVKSQPDDEPTITEKKPSAYGNVEHVAVGHREIPVISYVQAGMMTEAIDPFSLGEGFKTVAVDIPCSEHTFALRLKGKSMLPKFEDGDVVIFDPMVQPIPGSFVIAKNTDEEATFKKYRALGINGYGDAVFERHPAQRARSFAHHRRSD